MTIKITTDTILIILSLAVLIQGITIVVMKYKFDYLNSRIEDLKLKLFGAIAFIAEYEERINEAESNGGK